MASHRAGEKRIGHPLLADARARAVAADETDIVAKRQQFVGNRLDQRGVITAGNVAAPDRAVEQHVADMGKMHFLVVNTTLPGEWPGQCRMSKLNSPIET